MGIESVNIGMNSSDREHVCRVFETMLATSYHLYVKVQHAHWNVAGPHFQSYHLLFESIYTELAVAIDEIAERVRALGHFPHGSFTHFLEKSLLKDYTSAEPEKGGFLEQMLADHETLICFLREHLEGVEAVHDGASSDFINKRLMVSEKVAWQLRSHLA